MNMGKFGFVIFNKKLKMFWNESKDSLVENLNECTIYEDENDAKHDINIFDLSGEMDFSTDFEIWAVKVTIQTI